MSVACSCGIDGCRELGWPHEWDPVAAGDECALGDPGGGALRVFALGDPDPVDVVYDAGRVDGPLLEVRHLVRAPYVRWGSGYACAVCAEGEA
jgi:hypothetical protein